MIAGLEWHRRGLPHERFRLSDRMFELLTRGLGVSQILEQAAQPYDSPAERLNVAVRLRTVLVCALNRGHAPSGVKNTLRDLTRTLAYLDRRIVALVEEVAPERSGDFPWQEVTPMARDQYGAQVDVRDGLPSFTLVGYPDGRQATIAELLRHLLGAAWPLKRITVNVPDGWAPHDHALTALARAIHRAHTD